MEKKRKVKMHKLKREEEIIPAEKQKFTERKGEKEESAVQYDIQSIQYSLPKVVFFIGRIYLSMFVFIIEGLGILLI